MDKFTCLWFMVSQNHKQQKNDLEGQLGYLCDDPLESGESNHINGTPQPKKDGHCGVDKEKAEDEVGVEKGEFQVGANALGECEVELQVGDDVRECEVDGGVG